MSDSIRKNSHLSRNSRPDIAVVGAGALFPGSYDGKGFWKDILAGTDLITGVPASHWLVEDYYDPDPSVPDKTYANRGAFLGNVDFDAMGWGIPPTIVPETDTSQLLALIVAQKVLEDAATGPLEKMDHSRTSVILGVTSGQELLGSMVSRLQRPVWTKALREAGLPENEVGEICERIASHYTPWRESTFPGLLGNVVAGRIANRLNLGGTNCVTDAACASTLSSLSMAVNELYLGDSDMVITGGVDTMNDIFMFMCFSKTPALSPSGDCRPFSDKADGTMLGEGLGMVALKRLADAERDGNRIYAVIKAVGSSSDGRSKSVYAPVPEGQARALRRAYELAGYGPETVEFVEAHGTGTVAGDAAEFEGLQTVFNESGREERQWCALGSVKSQIGHTKAAAGAAGLFKAVMALHHRVVPPIIKIDRPNPALNLEASPFHLPSHARPWVRDSSHPRRASVSSFGFGGSNFHVALEEYAGDARTPRLRTFSHELVIVDGTSGAEVAARARSHAAAATKGGYLAWLAHESQRNYRADFAARLAVVASDEADLAFKLEQAAERIDRDASTPFSTPTGIYFGTSAREGGLAFLFPGQGSQYAGMGASLAMHFDKALAIWDGAAGLDWNSDTALQDVVFPRTAYDDDTRAAQAQRLMATEWAQPAIGCMSLSLLALLKEAGLEADCFGGHSFGEVTALGAAGVLSETDVVRVARRRGELMKDAARTPGSMIAVPLSPRETQTMLDGWGVDVVVANHNGPGQVVLSGTTADIEAVETKLKEAGIHSHRLGVATAFHSPVVADAAHEFAAWLGDVPFRAPSRPVYSNTTATAHPDDAATIRTSLGEQLAHPVLFMEMIEAMYRGGVRTFVEVGPGSILTDLTARILEGRAHSAIHLDRKGVDGLRGLLQGLAALVAGGHPLDFASLWSEYAAPANPHDRAQPKLILPINGSNYGKPYPPEGGIVPGPNPARASHARAPGGAGVNGVDGDAVSANGGTTFTATVATSGPTRPLSSRSPATDSKTNTTTPPAPAVAARVAASAAAPTVVARVATSTPAPTVVAARTSPAASTNPAPRAGISGNWAHAFESAQRQTADAHSAYIQAMARSHQAFLETVGHGFNALSHRATGNPGQVQISAEKQGQTPLSGNRDPWGQTPTSQVPVSRATEPEQVRISEGVAPAVFVEPPKAATHVVAGAAPFPLPAVTPTADLEALMLDIVSEKTGYPTEMLTMEMELEGDLGIDSIKRVEILAAMQERAPGLPEVEVRVMAKLRTLGQIVDYMNGEIAKAGGAATSAAGGVATNAARSGATHATGGVATSASGVSSATARAATNGNASRNGHEPHLAPAVDLQALMLDIVAEKTGYPTEMLTMEMELEGDLGIDSIKRVEILAAMQERAPGLPEVEVRVMAKLRTLGQIVDYMNGEIAKAGGAATSAADVATSGVAVSGVAPAIAPAAANGNTSRNGHEPSHHLAPAVDLQALMLDIVAEKTGYPTEMLTMEMELEGDLGIDSIKRVEILAAMQERAPGLPEVEVRVMAKLRTLGQIVDYMNVEIAKAIVPSDQAGAAATSTADATPAAPGRSEALGRFILEAVESSPIGMSRRGIIGEGRVVVTDDGTDLPECVVRELAVHGIAAEISQSIPATDLRGVIFLGGLRDVADDEEAIAVNREAFATAKAAAACFADHEDQPREGFFAMVQDTGGSFGAAGIDPRRAWLSGCAGLARTLAQEWPTVAVKAVDLERGDRPSPELARALVDELLSGGPDLDVGLTRDNRRIVLRSTEAPAAGGALHLADGDVVVASGGARGVTAATLVALAGHARLRFVLLGRTTEEPEPGECEGIADAAALKRVLLTRAKSTGAALTPAQLGRQVSDILARREIRATIEAIEAAGSQARYAATDVTSEQALAATLAGVRETWGPIHAVVHGAGVIQDRFVAEKTTEQFDRVFDTKVKGLRALLAATAADPLKALCLFSSVAARCGNMGQSDYAMANEILNKVARAEAARRGDACIVRSLGWGPWAGGMVSPELQARFEAMGVPLIDLASGAQMFVDELMGESGGADVELVLGGRPRPEALLPSPDGRRLSLDVTVSRVSHPYLSDHSIRATPVVPVALAIEWFGRAARAFAPELSLAALHDVKVLRGIPLRDFESGRLHLVVHCRQQSAGNDHSLALELADTNGAAFYRCVADMVHVRPAHQGFTNGRSHYLKDLQLEAWGDRLVYDGEVLFHGPRFQMIRSIDGVSDSGIAAHLDGVAAFDWHLDGDDDPSASRLAEIDDWHTDPVAFDGGLQLALLWCKHKLGRASLPTSIASVRTWSDGAASGPIHCTVIGRDSRGARSLSDVVFRDSRGDVFAEFEGVETHLVPEADDGRA